VRCGESAPLGQQREGQQKVVGRNQALDLTLQPLLALVVLAVRAKAMAADQTSPWAAHLSARRSSTEREFQAPASGMTTPFALSPVRTLAKAVGS